jgi:thiamine-phosphate pyrophosphorylase
LLLYYITDRTQFPGSEAERQRFLLEKIREAARCGIDYIQLREKDLSSRELESLAREAVQIVRASSSPRTENRDLKTALLINSRTDIALASGADGVHLPASEISASEVKSVWSRSLGSSSESNRQPGLIVTLPAIVGVSCHSAEEVRRAASVADFAVFGPVFEKHNQPRSAPAGLETLRLACAESIPVLALGGVTLENFKMCLQAGAAGVAGIRLFQRNDVCAVVERLRNFSAP